MTAITDNKASKVVYFVILKHTLLVVLGFYLNRFVKSAVVHRSGYLHVLTFL